MSKLFSLEQYVEQANSWNKIFGKGPYDLNNAKDRQDLANQIDSELSPENLTCDGELSGAQVRVQYQRLAQAADELKALDPTVKFYEY